MYENLEKAQSKQETIQDIALKVVEEQLRTLQTERDGKERTVFLLGSKGVGKSTVINKFFEREDVLARPTWALEYSYGRRSGQTQHLQKQVLNVWELGTVAHAADLISMPMNMHGVNNFATVLMLDLSKPYTMWHDFEVCYEGLIETCRQKLSFKELKDLKEQTALRLKQENVDDLTADLLPFPMVIVGGKYDEFLNLDISLRRDICQFLRSIAQLLGCAVLCYSHKIPKLAKTLRDTISHLGFGSPSNPFRSHITDAQEPLSIWFGTDNWNLINVDSAQPLTFQEIELRLNSAIPQRSVNTDTQKSYINPAKDAGFKESIIDDMRTQKDEVLSNFLRSTNLRAQFESIAD